MTPPSEQNLWWTAVQYLLDELGPVERTQFERLLEESQAARDAVLEAATLLRCIQSAASRPLASATFPERTLPTNWTAAMAGTLSLLWSTAALVLLSLWAFQPRPAPTPVPVEVAALWAELQAGSSEVVHEGEWWELRGAEEREAAIPEWLLAGVEEVELR